MNENMDLPKWIESNCMHHMYTEVAKESLLLGLDPIKKLCFGLGWDLELSQVK